MNEDQKHKEYREHWEKEDKRMASEHPIFQKLRAWAVRQRTYFQYGYGWVGNVGVGFLVADALKKYAFFEQFPVWVLFIVGSLAVWLLGWVAYSKGFLQEELDFKIKCNPILFKGLYKEAKKKGNL